MEETLHEIDILIEEYPYYSLLYFKRTKLLADNKNENYKKALQLASVYAPNRRKLQEFIENPTDYRKQIVIHPEWLSESTENHTQTPTLNMNDEELIKEILVLDEETTLPPVQETPIVKEVSEIKEILSHFTEENNTQNNTIQEIEQLKKTIQENQEKARLALFKNAEQEKTQMHTTDTITFMAETTDLNNTLTPEIQENTNYSILESSENMPNHAQTIDKNLVPETETIKEVKEDTTTDVQQEPVSLNVPKIKEWFEQELEAVRSEKEQEAKTEQKITQTTTKQENVPTEFVEEQKTEVSVEGYISWLDELLGMEKNAQKATKNETVVDKKALQNSIIDKFLENPPKISKPKVTESLVIEDKAKTQNVEYEDIASETLAKIFVMQKQYDRAIRIYRVLISKNPAQKDFYEQVIKDIESKMN